MATRLGLWTTIALLAANHTTAQAQQLQGPPQGPDQPVYRRVPTVQQRPAPPPATMAPFRLTPQEEAYLDQVLIAWQRRSEQVKTFESDFTRWEYDPVFGDAEKPKYRDDGKLKYAAPDRGMFKVEGDRAEHWISDGKSIFQYNFAKKQLIEHKLPAHLQGKAIANSPLPFLFGARAADLKRRYWMRIVTPANVKNQIWLEAYPRFREDAANFHRAELILKAAEMTPHALQIHLPNGKNRTVYQFYNIAINDPLKKFFRINPFHASTPLGWQKIVEKQPRSAQALRPPEAEMR